MPEMKDVTFTVQEPILTRLEAHAKKKKVTVSELVNCLCDDFFIPSGSIHRMDRKDDNMPKQQSILSNKSRLI